MLTGGFDQPGYERLVNAGVFTQIGLPAGK
jgi:hypothetical protein